MQENLVVKKATPLGARVWTSLLVFGFIGQIAWMVENVYFSTYIQKNITAAGWATSATVAASAIAAALATIFSAAWSDRVGKRRAFVCWGYILWGITTAAFALFGNGQVGGDVGLAVTLFVVMDCVMSAIGQHGQRLGLFRLGHGRDRRHEPRRRGHRAEHHAHPRAHRHLRGL